AGRGGRCAEGGSPPAGAHTDTRAANDRARSPPPRVRPGRPASGYRGRNGAHLARAARPRQVMFAAERAARLQRQPVWNAGAHAQRQVIIELLTEALRSPAFT